MISDNRKKTSEFSKRKYIFNSNNKRAIFFRSMKQDDPTYISGKNIDIPENAYTEIPHRHAYHSSVEYSNRTKFPRMIREASQSTNTTGTSSAYKYKQVLKKL